MDQRGDRESARHDALMLLCEQIGKAQLRQSEETGKSRDEQHLIRRDLEVIKERLEPIRTLMPRIEAAEKHLASHSERLGTHRRELDELSDCFDHLKTASDKRSGWEAPSGKLAAILLAAALGALATYMLNHNAHAAPKPGTQAANLPADGKCWAVPAPNRRPSYLKV